MRLKLYYLLLYKYFKANRKLLFEKFFKLNVRLLLAARH